MVGGISGKRNSNCDFQLGSGEENETSCTLPNRGWDLVGACLHGLSNIDLTGLSHCVWDTAKLIKHKHSERITTLSFQEFSSNHKNLLLASFSRKDGSWLNRLSVVIISHFPRIWNTSYTFSLIIHFYFVPQFASASLVKQPLFTPST